MTTQTERNGRSGREAEGGGLLIHSALFVLTPFHLYSTTYDPIICIGCAHLQPRVHRECTGTKQTTALS